MHSEAIVARELGQAGIGLAQQRHLVPTRTHHLHVAEDVDLLAAHSPGSFGMQDPQRAFHGIHPLWSAVAEAGQRFPCGTDGAGIRGLARQRAVMQVKRRRIAELVEHVDAIAMADGAL